MPIPLRTFVVVAAAFGAVWPTHGAGVGSILEQESESSLSLLQLRAHPISSDNDMSIDLHVSGAQQTPCAFCQSECRATEIAFKNQCLERGHHWVRCAQRGEKRARPCLDACPCSGNELADEEDERVKQAAKEQEIVDGKLDKLEKELEDEEEEAKKLEPPASQLQVADLPILPDKDVVSDFHVLDSQQTPCEFCQSECLVAKIAFKNRCRERGHNWRRCEVRGEKRARPCLDACPCSGDELAAQEDQVIEQAAQEQDVVDGEIKELEGDADRELEPPSSQLQIEAVPIPPNEDVVLDLHSADAHQTPCEFCQSQCMAVEVAFKSRCLERGHNWWHCEARGQKRARPCLDACPCSPDELEQQDEVEGDMAQEENENIDREPEDEIADIGGRDEDDEEVEEAE